MGVVVSCSGRQARWDIATKVLRDGLAETKGRLARFKREAKVLALLNHPGIAAIRGPPPKTLRAPPYAIRRNLRRIMLRHDWRERIGTSPYRNHCRTKLVRGARATAPNRQL